MELLSDGAASGAEQGTGALLSPVQVAVQDTSVAGACLSLALGSQLLGLGLREESRAWHL